MNGILPKHTCLETISWSKSGQCNIYVNVFTVKNERMLYWSLRDLYGEHTSQSEANLKKNAVI